MTNDPTSEFNSATGDADAESDSTKNAAPMNPSSIEFETETLSEDMPQDIGIGFEEEEADDVIESLAIRDTAAEIDNQIAEAKKEKILAPVSEKKSRTKTKLGFKVGQDVVYPLQGVGKIIEQMQRDFKGQAIDYYTIYIEATDMTVMLPQDKAQELGLRPIVAKADAEQALKSMSDKNEPLTSDWKLRYQNNLDLLKEGGVMDIATVVRSLYHRSKVKELPILERKLYDNALKLMVDEISLALGREKEKVEDLLHTRLENSNN